MHACHLEDRALSLEARGSLDDEDTGRSRHLIHMEHRSLRTDLGVDLVAVLSIRAVLLVFARSLVAGPLVRCDAAFAVGPVLFEAGFCSGCGLPTDAGVLVAVEGAVCLLP